MAAITAAVDRRRKMYPAPLPVDYPMKASEAIVAGALVNIDSNGYAVSATESASDLLCVGVALETKTASATNGADSISVDTDGIYLFTHGTGDAMPPRPTPPIFRRASSTCGRTPTRCGSGSAGTPRTRCSSTT